MSGKIAFIGTHGVGKTVLTFELACTLRKRSIDAEVATESSRLCPFPINEATTQDAQTWILMSQCKTELEVGRRADVVICDRSVIDNYAYMVNAVGRQLHLEPFLSGWLTGYDLLVRVPIIGGITTDGTRATCTEFQRSIDRRVVDLIDEFGFRERTVDLPTDRSRHLPIVLRELETRGVVSVDLASAVVV